MDKILTREALLTVVKALREEGKKIVFTNGCFDLIHVGHVRYLRAAKELGDVLIVGLNSDDSVRRLKGPHRPISCQEDRAEILAALEFVDYITVFDEDTPYNLIAIIVPDVLVKGGDWDQEKIVGRDIVESRGGKVTTIPFTEGKSTTNLIKRITDTELK
ncbi:MAG TPA: D-glycero-beta-D-manno-heptose 1-phosphate adenylyltransferase [Syntrophales bacterium]|nr:D-glycero-beta-D-manno-heptose 1-phosphate adenylyltransferase [Syntrophales bacterium]HOL58421.1 D-glycero-beta-D-manno-heptose 1-phosphate adenylyltransferase [Syntrophales bacterium]HPO34590.1 D-glycero-beta-D-manno-heptose 1-phosphate adenylyltransferase [Syntrophales bacterium]